MAGNNSITNLETISFTDNMSFDGTERGGAFDTNGQVWLGSGTLPHVRKSIFTSSDASVSFVYSDTSATEGQMDVTITGGTTVGKTLRGNTGPLISPVAGNWNIYGSGSLTSVSAGNTLTMNLTGLTNHSVLVGAGTNTITNLAVGGNGQVLLGSLGADPVFNDVNPGTGISVQGGPGTLTINAIGGGLSWADITIASVTLAINNGYISNRASLVTYTLPAVAGLGAMFAVTNINVDVGWRIAQRAGQQIRLGSSLTTSGVGGYLESTQLGDSIVLICTVANTSFIAINWVGFLTIV
mgnify:CR=1 FL=1